MIFTYFLRRSVVILKKNIFILRFHQFYLDWPRIRILENSVYRLSTKTTPILFAEKTFPQSILFDAVLSLEMVPDVMYMSFSNIYRYIHKTHRLSKHTQFVFHYYYCSWINSLCEMRIRYMEQWSTDLILSHSSTSG